MTYSLTDTELPEHFNAGYHHENSENSSSKASETHQPNAEHENSSATGQNKVDQGSLAVELRHEEVGVGARTLEQVDRVAAGLIAQPRPPPLNTEGTFGEGAAE